MKSMTGYGKGVAEKDFKRVSIEIKTLNNRFLDINTRLPKSLIVCDEVIRQNIQEKIKRGSVEVYFNYVNNSENTKTIFIDSNLASQYVDVAKGLSEELDLMNDVAISTVLKVPEIMKIETADDDPEILVELTETAIKSALDDLDRMRSKEGESICEDFTLLICKIESALFRIRELANKVVDDYREKIKKRITEYLGEVEIDQARLLNEVAFFADKADINEEISRLGSHISQFRLCLTSEEALGRKLDFLTQEMGREINTLGSKSNNIEITNLVLEMKNELEKLKEQIRNVE